MILGMVAARGGSKGFPRKNTAILDGKSLVAWAVEALLDSKLVNAVMISTDDPQIAKIAIQAGADFLDYRPKELAGDFVGILPVLKFECKKFEKEKSLDVSTVVLTLPTTPFRNSKHIDEALQLLINTPKADCIVSVHQTPHQYSLESQLKIEETGFLKPLSQGGDQVLQRQDKTVTYARNGPCLLALKRQYLESCSNLYEGKVLPYRMKQIHGHDIDNERDLSLAQAMINANFFNEG